MSTKILVVEDDIAIQESMCAFLNASGYLCSSANSAEEALDAIGQDGFQVVITDIMLPGINGLDLTAQIKKDKDIDVMVMTGYSADYSYEEAIRTGASDFVFKPIRFEELALRLKRVINERQLRQERKVMLEKLNKLAITDGLTRLYNSRYFFQQLRTEVNRALRYHHPLALLLMDIDYFKKYNDTYGHLEGDRVLAKIGQIIQSRLRNMDTAYRYGGEEFTVILPETRCNEAENAAKRIKNAIETVAFTPETGNKVRITLSVGLTEYKSGEPVSDFIRRADQAMYKSKANGRSRVTSALISA